MSAYVQTQYIHMHAYTNIYTYAYVFIRIHIEYVPSKMYTCGCIHA